MYHRSIKQSASRPRLFWTSALLTVTLLAGCDKQPEGQVVAVVNGDEVTMQELNTELGNAQLPEGAARDEMRNRALDNIINRRLLAEVAREQGIDDSPEFITRRRQLEEALLVQMLAQQTARPMKQPTAQEVNEFVAQNPQMFANRAILTLDQVRFPAPANQDYVKALEPASTMAEVVTTLNRLGIRFERGTARVDTASLSPEMFSRVSSIGSSEPFVIPGPAVISVSQIVSSQPAPPPQNQVTPAATNMIRQRNLSNELNNMIKTAKGEAGIDYQPGFAAPKSAAGNSAETALETSAKATSTE